ncbi:hypothetical protein AAH979_05680 [Plantactinospora sp. ZYX-F-223]|uniref:hypothetical protein n=1 Tax=Plantactinospora sp. ZYX-F-223 TaxID=3144103 RepID=UPI0031FD6C9C
MAPGRQVIRRYEQLLGLPAGQLTTIADALLRLETPTRRQPSAGRFDGATFHITVEKISAGDALDGAEWARLTEQIESAPGLVLHPPKLWSVLAERLLTELVAADKLEWLLRNEAMSRLLEHPAARSHAVAACIALAEDGTSPAVIEPLGLLDVVSDGAANRYIVQQITHPEGEPAFQGALRAALRKIEYGHFVEAELRQLVPVVRERMCETPSDPGRIALSVEVARRLAGRAGQRSVLQGAVPRDPIAHWVWTSDRLAEPGTARTVSCELARLVQARGCGDVAELDDVLVSLIEEALYSSNPDRRLFHGQLLAATPLRETLGEAVLTEMTAGLGRRDETFAVAALPVMTVLDVSTHRTLVRRILASPGFSPTLRHAAARALPHCAGRFSEPVWRTILDRQLAQSRSADRLGADILRAIVYGIGTDGCTGLLASIRADPGMPPGCRSTADWQLSLDA